MKYTKEGIYEGLEFTSDRGLGTLYTVKNMRDNLVALWHGDSLANNIYNIGHLVDHLNSGEFVQKEIVYEIY